MTTVTQRTDPIARPPAPKRDARRGDIQGLRGIAVLLVMAGHFTGVPRSGFTGVDVFFVISGFVITTGLLSEAERTGRVSLVRFYGRRFQRIAPAALVTLAAVVAMTALLPPTRGVAVNMDALWGAFGVENLRVVLSGAVLARNAAVVSPVGHFWSLAVEEQFYLVWPLLMLLVWTAGRHRGAARRWLLRAALIAAVVSFVFGAWDSSLGTGEAYFSTAARGWELGTGVVLAILAPHLHRMGALVRSVLAVTGVAAVAVGAVSLSQAAAYPAPGALLPVAGAAALIAAGTGGTSPLAATLGSRGMRWVGDRSYSLYLWHFPVLVFTLTFFPSAAMLVLAGALSVLLAALSYRFVERPVLRLFRDRSGNLTGASPTPSRSTVSLASSPTPSRSTPSRA